MDLAELKNIIEALLLSSQDPVTLEKIAAVFEEQNRPSDKELFQVIESLSLDYINRSYELTQSPCGYQIQTRAKYAPWVARMQSEKPIKYSRALLETLAIIAYKQPVTRADIEELRGVSLSSLIIKTLLEREWIRIIGHKDVPGKPAVYATTKEFLNYFNLNDLHELPSLVELRELVETGSSYERESVNA